MPPACGLETQPPSSIFEMVVTLACFGVANMESLARSQLLPSNTEVELPILVLPHVVLFPGENLPLRVWELHHVRLLLLLAFSQRRGQPAYLGILNARRRSLMEDAVVGCTCEMFEVESDWDGSSPLTAKAKGRQRFRVLDAARGGNMEMRQGIPHVRVLILSDECVSAYPRLPQWQRSKLHQCTYWPTTIMGLLSPACLLGKVKQILHSIESWQGVRCATGFELCRIAGFSSDCLDGEERGREGADEEEGAPVEMRDAVSLSFRLAASLPLDDITRQRLLAMDSVVYRLQNIILLLKNTAESKLCCAHCEVALVGKGALFSVPGAEGTVGAYSNPAGVVHQMLTVREVLDEEENVALEGPIETEGSWFEGYAWTIAYCRRCSLHLGWLFTCCEVNREESTNLPRFWGIRRQALVDELQCNAQRVPDSRQDGARPQIDDGEGIVAEEEEMVIRMVE